MVAARDALIVDPGMGRKKLSKVATNMVVEDESDDKSLLWYPQSDKLELSTWWMVVN